MARKKKKGAASRSTMLLFGDNPQIIQELAYIPSVTEKELLDEYGRLRKLGLQRLRRLEKAGYGGSKTIEAFRGDLLPVSQLRGKGAGSAASALARVTQLMTSETTTVSGMRDYESRMSAALQQSGYDIASDQVRYFGKYMEWAREVGLVAAFGSGDTARAFSERSERAKSRGSNTVTAWKRAIAKHFGQSWKEIENEIEGM